MDWSGFPIPAKVQDLLNSIFQKKESLYTREETPAKVSYTYGERTYRGVPVPYIDSIALEYDSSVGTEVYTSVRDSEGRLVGTRKVMARVPPETLAL